MFVLMSRSQFMLRQILVDYFKKTTSVIKDVLIVHRGVR